MANATAQDHDITHPVTATGKTNEGAQEIRLVRSSLADRLDKEHVTIAASGAGGQHKAGSAFAFYNADPGTNITTTLDGVTLSNDDNGRLAVDLTAPTLQVYVHPSWTDFAYVPLSWTVATGAYMSGTVSGSGTGLDVTNSSTGKGIRVQNTSTGKGYSSDNLGAGEAVNIDNASTGIGVYILNRSTGIGIEIDNTSTGKAIDIDHDNETGTDIILVNLDGRNASGGGDIIGEKIYVQTDTGDAIVFSVDANNTGGSGKEYLFDCSPGEAGEIAGHTKTGANAYDTGASGGGTFTCTGYFRMKDDAGNEVFVPYGTIANT